MNEILEFWTPWQALQRSLANGFGVEAAGAAPVSMAFNSAAAAGSNWLARARSSTPPAPAQRTSR